MAAAAAVAAPSSLDLHVLEADALEPEALRALLAGVGAWANVSHRNVVAVHEIARDEGVVRVFFCRFHR